MDKTTILPSDYAFLLEPISPEKPCGDDLEYDPYYMELFIRIVPKEKKIIGGGMGNERLESEFEPIRWSEVERDCLSILQRTRDLRLLLVLLRCRIQQAQAAGLRQGLFILERLLTFWPDDLFPLMVNEGERDPLSRSDALMSLVEVQGVLADIRGLLVSGSGGLRLEVRDVERSFSIPLPEDALPPEAMRHRLQELRGQQAQGYLSLLDSLHLCRSIDQLVRQQLGSDAPDLAPLLTLLGRLELRGVAADPGESVQTSAPNEEVPTPQETPTSTETLSAMPQELHPTPAGIDNRHVARERIREVRLWFEEHEPSSPVPILLRQAEQLIGRRFADLKHCLPDDLLEKWENN